MINTLNDADDAAETYFENIATDLLSGLLGAHDNEQNALLKAWLDEPFKLDNAALLRHAEYICGRFNAGDDSHLLMHGIDEQLDAMSLSNNDRQKPTKFGAVRAATTGRDVAKVNALLKVIITYYECELIKLKKDK
ncbi:hypothetical protein LPW36_15450 [Jinshanibacter sp. LJY008]|uniref:Uncharacterized protein n=1 Tax=Limnobaculum eriocheiris TaxID=2897391 RepID=A0A9X1SLR1_9GAMM|nr:hypothetical protein [Limnobaculum eriocheiris]MCD1127371.1 hypothetical protein [Limnobaculum eriocheiris]